MSFNYSCFISYRRNSGEHKFVKKCKSIIESIGGIVTNKQEVFFDEDSIKFGQDFDEKIYNGIATSYFFIPFYHNSYLHIDNLWCAKELFRAIKLEEIIRKEINKEYCFILPLIQIGSLNALPSCINKKNTKEIRQLEPAILSNKTTVAVTKFKNLIHDVLLESFELLKNKELNLKEISDTIPFPQDSEIIEWINQQNGILKIVEAQNLPRFK